MYIFDFQQLPFLFPPWFFSLSFFWFIALSFPRLDVASFLLRVCLMHFLSLSLLALHDGPHLPLRTCPAELEMSQCWQSMWTFIHVPSQKEGDWSCHRSCPPLHYQRGFVPQEIVFIFTALIQCIGAEWDRGCGEILCIVLPFLATKITSDQSGAFHSLGKGMLEACFRFHKGK